MSHNSNSPDQPVVVAFYLPQFHPIPENDDWWGKGFTEWTNVGKARPLFPGHYQPHVPADLGYYDLRLPETRQQQASMAKLYGVDGFCYWHYWFGNGKRLLEKPFNDVLASGKPEFPFCLGWANHSWEAKNWSTKKQQNRILIDQKYPGLKDCHEHFEFACKAFRDKRYLMLDGKPVFIIWNPVSLPQEYDYLSIWRELAAKDGLNGISFVGFTYHKEMIDKIYDLGYDHVIYDGLVDSMKSLPGTSIFSHRLIRRILGLPIYLKYSLYQKISLEILLLKKVLPCILPNYDHTPRSGRQGLVLESNPRLFEGFLRVIMNNIKENRISAPILFVKSWNEWGEGNHLEPDLKFTTEYLEALKKVLSEDCPHP